MYKMILCALACALCLSANAQDKTARPITSSETSHKEHFEGLVEGQGFLERKQSQLILHLKGSPYEMGYQHGKLLKELIQTNISTFIDKANPALQTRVQSFQKHLPQLLQYIPERFHEEMRGLSDGSQIPLEKIIALNVFPEMFHCSGITICDEATKDKELYHVRILDYAVGKSLQNTAVLMLFEPQEGNAFINVSYAGFIGSVTGMNDHKIAMGEIGGWGYGQWDGMPMSFLFRDILERACTLTQAKTLLSQTPRTCEYYYVISDGNTNTSVGVYATASQIHFIQPGSAYALLAPKNLPRHYGTTGDHDKFCLAPCELKTTPYQTLLFDQDKNVALLYHTQPAHSLIITGFSYPERYPLIAEGLLAHWGSIDETVLQKIIRCPVSRSSNLHNVIFLPSQLKLWVAHAGPNNEPACDQKYTAFSFLDIKS